MKRLFAFAALAFAAALFLAACGGGGGDGSSRSSRSTGKATTVATKGIDGKSVLVDADGNALYMSDQEASGAVKCTGSCGQFWEPLTIQDGQPSGTISGGTLGMVQRPDGKAQVTFNGAPLYHFTQDQPGQVTGDGFDDAFDGQQFTWHVATAGNTPSAPKTTSGSGPSGY
ncbi:MAG TPA: hypothetical protein VHY55_09175 [Acidimicrobiia bacterium]|jgi:predicted lipoprotein with Yx(FWY)xxD motif|nr:hypothetical protein [Acidimicrobiia bacterium]